MYNRGRYVGAFMVWVLLAGCGGGEVASSQSVSVNSRGLALGGYDPLSYYQNGPRVGNPDYRYDYWGGVFFFTSAINREKFASSPETFLPQYGGHCAFAMESGTLAEGDPKAYTLQHGKLYLNASPAVKHLWRWIGDVAESDAQWRRLAEDH